jgi:hypothetical protein
MNGTDPLGLWTDPIKNPQLRGFYNAGWTPNQSTFGQVRGSGYHQGIDIFRAGFEKLDSEISGNLA